MTLLRLLVWFFGGTPKPRDVRHSLERLEDLARAVVVPDTACLRDWLYEGRHGFVSEMRLRRGVSFLWHFAQMAVAMVLGMLALGPVLRVAPYLNRTHPSTHLLVMAVFMSLPMVAWMLFRGHGWERSVEMAGAMFAPVALVIVINLVGLISRMVILSLGHELMSFAMLGLMLRRWNHYAQQASDHREDQSESGLTTESRPATATF